MLLKIWFLLKNMIVNWINQFSCLKLHFKVSSILSEIIHLFYVVGLFFYIYFETNFDENLEIEYDLTYPNNNVAATWWHLYCPIGHSQKEDETIPLSSRNICNIMNFYYFFHSEVYLTVHTFMPDGCVYQSLDITVCRVRELCINLPHAMVYIYTEIIIYWWNWSLLVQVLLYVLILLLVCIIGIIFVHAFRVSGRWCLHY